MMNIEACVAYYVSKGLEKPGARPEYRSDLMRDFETRCRMAMEAWCEQHVDYTAFRAETDDGSFLLDIDWEVDLEEPHRFKVVVPGLEVEDLWWFVEDHVVYSDIREHTCRAGRRYISEEFCLSVLAQVVGFTPEHSSSPQGGAVVHMVINKCVDEERKEEWELPVVGGFADWQGGE